MANNHTNEQQSSSQPDAELKRLERLVGKWKISGGAKVTVTYEWMEGGFFLIQRVAVNDNKGIEIIGRERLFGATEPSQDIKSRYYGSDGSTFDYVYELDGDTLTIWGGEKGSPAFYKGTFGNNGNTLDGSWVWPGGGYDSTATRVKK